MSALLFIQNNRKALERIEFVGMIQLAMHGKKEDVEKAMSRWAKQAEIDLTFED